MPMYLARFIVCDAATVESTSSLISNRIKLLDHMTTRSHHVWTWLGLGLTALLAGAPLLLEPRPVVLLTSESVAGSTLAIATLWGVVAVRAWRDGVEGESAGWTIAFAVAAAGMAVVHWFMVDAQFERADWQRRYYLAILNHTADAPHNYRPLPYGFARLLERLTGDWVFAGLLYRWFFTFWFLWAAYRLARLVHNPRRALWTLVPLLALYPLSIAYYYGQLTDPMSHAFLVLGVIWIVEDRPWELAAALALGVMAKETAVLLVAAYFACYWRSRRGWLMTTCLGAVSVLAFLVVRLPVRWLTQERNINGLDGLMIGTNLGIGEPRFSGAAPTWQNYLHPLLFVGVFVPVLAWRWRELNVRLRTVCMVLTPLLLASSLCWSWLYESRNYMPLVPLLATLALPPTSKDRYGKRDADCDSLAGAAGSQP
jgi:hypothetical protein